MSQVTWTEENVRGADLRHQTNFISNTQERSQIYYQLIDCSREKCPWVLDVRMFVVGLGLGEFVNLGFRIVEERAMEL